MPGSAGRSRGTDIDAGRVIADLRELQRRTGDAEGAQRVCWTETWREARAYLRELLSEIELEPEIDEAGNAWTYLPGEGEPLPVEVALATGGRGPRGDGSARGRPRLGGGE